MTLLKTYFSVRGTKPLFGLSMVLSATKTAVSAHMIYVVSKLLDSIVAGEDWTGYLYLFIAEQVVFTVSQYFREIVWRKVTQVSYTELSDRAMDKMLAADYDTFTTTGEGHMNRVIETISDIANSGKSLLGAINAVISLIVLIVAIARVYSGLVVPIALLYVGFGTPIKYLNRRIGKCDDAVTAAKGKRSGVIERIVQGFAELRATCQQDTHRDEFHELNMEVYVAVGKKVLAISEYILMLNGIDIITSLMVVLYASKAIPGGMSPSLAMTLVWYGWELMNPMGNLIDCLDEFSVRRSSFKVYKAFMETPVKIKDGFITLNQFHSGIEFERVDFSYEQSDMILNDISFKIHKGEKIGIVGASGCGKTTLLKLLERFYDPCHGTIWIDGVDTSDYTLASLRDKMGYIQQDPFIFNGTILDNIMYGGNAICYTDEEITEACKKAAIYDFIMKLPGRFETVVGPSGLKLSGGQKQRLALARVFLRDPDIILLDEATSALDNECENIVQEAIAKMEGKTVIAIAHRLTTVKDFDRLLVFDEHRLVEEGTHYDLIDRGGVYSRLWFAK